MILFARLTALIARLPEDIALIAARLFVAMVFWNSARTKVDGFTITDSTWFLFDQVYALPVIPSAWAAVLATLAEHILPVLLIFGLFTRFAALGLLVMTAVIQLFVFPEAWVTHGLWAASLLTIMRWGPGRLALDPFVGVEPPRGA